MERERGGGIEGGVRSEVGRVGGCQMVRSRQPTGVLIPVV
jgi:hypothetical protein